MGIFTKMRGWFAPRVERSSSGIPASSGLFGGLGGMQTSSGMMVSQATAMQVSVVYACVRRIATDCARCSGGLFETEDGIQRPTTHGSADLLVRPNAQQTWFEFAEQLHVSELLRGNAYAVALRDRHGSITQMIPINPDFVTILESADGEVFYQISPCGLWLMAMLRDQPVCIPQEDVFHFRGLTFNTLVGVSTISVARDAIGLAIGQEQQAAHWMEAGARPGGILMVDKALSPDAAKRLRDQWNNLKAGIQNVGATAVLRMA
jgi:HK97 family phage portal protein